MACAVFLTLSQDKLVVRQRPDRGCDLDACRLDCAQAAAAICNLITALYRRMRADKNWNLLPVLTNVASKLFELIVIFVEPIRNGRRIDQIRIDLGQTLRLQSLNRTRYRPDCTPWGVMGRSRDCRG